jgi:hypothetical protein
MWPKSHFLRPHTQNKQNLSQFQALPVNSSAKITFGFSLFYLIVVVASLKTAAIGRDHLRPTTLLSDKIFY